MWVWPSGYRTVSLAGPLLHGALIAAALAPAWALHVAIARMAALPPASILLLFDFPVLYATYVFSLLVLVPTVARILHVWSQEGRIPLSGIGFRKFSAYCALHAVAQVHALHTVRNTALMVWYCRLMGAKIGANCAIGTTLISDFNLISIGDNTLIGYNVEIIPHLAEYGGVTLAPIFIGSRVSIGNGSMIFPGAHIEDDVIVGANSIVPKGAHLLGGVVYVGSPARPAQVSSISEDMI